MTCAVRRRAPCRASLCSHDQVLAVELPLEFTGCFRKASRTYVCLSALHLLCPFLSVACRCLGFTVRPSSPATHRHRCSVLKFLPKPSLSPGGRCGRGVPDPPPTSCLMASKSPCLGLHFRISQREKILLRGRL